MLFQSIKMAWESIRSNKMRSFLTMLGMIIGVLSLVVLVSIANGATSSVTSSISSMASNTLTVAITDDKDQPIKLSELESYTDNQVIKAVSPAMQSQATVKSDYNSDTAKVYGVSSSYLDIEEMELASGRFLKTPDLDNYSYVAVVSMDIVTDIMGYSSPALAVGNSVKLDGKEYQVIGVLKEDDTQSVYSSSSDYSAYIAYTSLIRLSDNVSGITSFVVSSTAEEIDMAGVVVDQMLLERLDYDEDAYTVINSSDVSDVMENVTSTLALMLGGIAGISLLVGGIGIMNIMLVSVTERTREIGIRKAIGAGTYTILLQFLIESLLICFIGSLIGVAASWGVLRVIGMVSGDAAMYTISKGVVLVAVGFSLVIGVLFGLYPANKAAKKKPIDALRFS